MSVKNKSKIQLKAEKDYVSGMTYVKLSEKYKVSIGTIKNWRKKYDWTREKVKNVSESDTKKGNCIPKSIPSSKNSKKTGNKKGTLLRYETTTLEEYEEIRRDLQTQLNNNGVQGRFYDDLIDIYMKMYTIKNKLILDIEERGVNVEWSNGKQTSVKKNDSIGELNKTVSQMLSILSKLGLDIPVNKNINPGGCGSDEAL